MRGPAQGSRQKRPRASRPASTASMKRSFRVTAKGMSETDAGQVGEDFPHDRFILQLGPRPVAGDADKELVARPAETILQRDLEKRGNRVGVAVTDHMAVVDVPEPYVLRIPGVVLEHPVLARGDDQARH